MKHRGSDGMPSEVKENIHSLLNDHQQITRKVEVTKNGYRATTTSDDPKVVTTLQAHVKQMEARLEQGKGARRWDPAFAEFKAHRKDIKSNVTLIKNGVRAEMTGTTPEAIKVVQNHGAILSKFAEKGAAEMHRFHPAVGKKGGSSKFGRWLKGASSGDKCCLKDKECPTTAKACCLKDKKCPTTAKACCLKDKKCPTTAKACCLKDKKCPTTAKACCLKDKKCPTTAKACCLKDKKAPATAKACCKTK